MTVANSLVVKIIRARREALLGIIITIIMNMSMGISSMDISTICKKQQVERNKCVSAPSSVAAATTSLRVVTWAFCVVTWAFSSCDLGLFEL